MRFDDRIDRQTRTGSPETAALTGLRFQYIPEFDDSFDPARAAEIYEQKASLFQDIVSDSMAEGNVSDARLTFYDTQVFFRDNYNEFLGKTASDRNREARGELSGSTNAAQSNNGREVGAELPEPVRNRSGQAPSGTGSSGQVTPSNAPQGTLGDALTQLNITPQRIKQWRNSREGLRQEMVPQVQQAAEALREGKISTEEYQRTVQQYQPIKPLTARETNEIARLVAAEAGHTEYNPIGSPSGVQFINFDYLGTPNLDFQKVVNNALKQMNFDYGELFDVEMFGADTGYLGNNWKENLNGEGYLESGELARRPDLQRKVRDLVTRLAPRVSAVEEGFANRYNWNRNTALNSSYEAQQAVGAPSGTDIPAPEIPESPATARPFKQGGNVERVTNDNRKYF